MTHEKARHLYEVYDGCCMAWIAAETCEPANDDAPFTDFSTTPPTTLLCREWVERAGKSCVVLTEDW